MPLFERKLKISGDIIIYHCTMKISEEGPAYETLETNRNKMEIEIKAAITQELGMEELELRDLRIYRGSIEVWVIIGAATAILLGFSRYKNFIESAELLKSQIEGILRRMVDRYGVRSMQTDTILHPAISRMQSQTSYSGNSENSILLFYLLISHTVLLAVFIWMLVKFIGRV